MEGSHQTRRAPCPNNTESPAFLDRFLSRLCIWDVISSNQLRSVLGPGRGSSLRAVIGAKAKLVVVPAGALTNQVFGRRPARYTSLVFAGGLHKRLSQSDNIRRAIEALKSWDSSTYKYAGACSLLRGRGYRRSDTFRARGGHDTPRHRRSLLVGLAAMVSWKRIGEFIAYADGSLLD